MMAAMQIHIVEDDPVIAADIKLTQSCLGHVVTGVSHSASQCIRALEDQKVDLLLLDIDLGKNQTDGIALSQLVTSKYNYPFIYLTSYYDDATLKKVSLTKPLAYILKPFEERDLKVA